MKTKCAILVIEDSQKERKAYERLFKKEKSCTYVLAGSVSEAKDMTSAKSPDVIICKYKLPDGTAFDILKAHQDTPVIVITGKGNIKTAVSIMKNGAYEYLEKDKDGNYLKELPAMIENAASGRHAAGPADKNASQYRDIVDAAHVLIWRTDTEGRFTFLNPAWENYGYKVQEMLGRPFSDFQIPDAAEYYVNAFRNCLIGESVVGHETTYFSKNGEAINLVVNLIPIFDSSRSITGTQGTAYDITEQKRADELLQYISAKDELTGLYNLHTFMSMTEQQMKTANREKMEMLFIYAGVDNMQSINETYGYDTGDQLLIDTANILRKTFREADLLARTGGDEFVVSTLVSSRDMEKIIMGRLLGNLDTYNADKDHLIRLTLSCGTSFYHPGHPVSIDELLSGADSKMHEHKQNRKKKGIRDS